MIQSENQAFAQTAIFDIPVSRMNMQETIDYLSARIDAAQPTQVITANPIMVMAAIEDADYKSMMQQADLIVPDGAGLVWAAKKLKQPVQERVAGIDLMMELLKLAEQNRWPVYFLGASAEVLDAAVNQLIKQFPTLPIAGYRDGYFSAEQDQQVVEDIRQANPKLLFVGRAASQQEPWIQKFKHELNVPVMMGVGGSYDVLSGRLKRAPKLWQTMKLEWLYRLMQEPWRFKRMLAIPKFMWLIMKKR